RARTSALESLLAERWTEGARPPVIAYVARFLGRMNHVLDALRAFASHAYEPRTAPLFAVDAVASRALQRLYGWCGALLAELEELARDTEVMLGDATPCDRSRAEEA